MSIPFSPGGPGLPADGTPAITTPLTHMLGMRYPIVQAGMSWISSCAALPRAVTEAGGLGVLAAGPMRIHDFIHEVDQLRHDLDGPWAVNVPLYRPGSAEILAHLLKVAPPLIIAGQGGARGRVEPFHAVGTRWFHVVASLEHAHKAIDAGVDGLVVVGAEAGGHPPATQVSTMVLTRLVARELPGVPVISSGGVADGAGVAAALALGAAGAQLGTRFIATDEARAHPAYKNAVVAAGVADTSTVGHELGLIRSLTNSFTRAMTELERSGASIEQRREMFGSVVLRQAVLDGDVEFAKLEAGQTTGLVRSIEPASKVVADIAAELATTLRRLGASVPALAAKVP